MEIEIHFYVFYTFSAVQERSLRQNRKIIFNGETQYIPERRKNRSTNMDGAKELKKWGSPGWK